MNLPREVCHHLIGEHHKPSHRMVCGLVVMGVGVGIAKSAGFFESHAIHFTLDMVGYAVHGLGCTPYIELLLAESA